MMRTSLPSTSLDPKADSAPLGSWGRFLHQVLHDLQLWIFCVLYLTLFRVLFITYFRQDIDPASGWHEILRTAFFGLRYDVKVATLWIAAPFLVSAGSGFADLGRFADRFRGWWGSAFVVLSSIAFGVTIGFYQEYGDQFNHFLFNLYYDDTRAIVATIWAAYHPLLYLTVISIAVYAALWMQKRFFSRGFLPEGVVAAFAPPLAVKAFITFLIVMLLAAGARGSFGSRPLKLHDAVATKDEFLNKAVLNPYIALLQAFSDHAKVGGVSGIELYLPDKDVKKAAQVFFKRTESFSDLDLYMLKNARGAKNKPPRHVVLVLMESYDTWPLQQKYQSLGVTNNLRQLAREGISVEHFLPSGTWTLPAFCTLLTDLPYTVPISYQDASRKAYPSSIAETFKRLGFRTRFFYGGFLNWEKVGDLAKAQGFEEIYGALHIKDKASMDAWGKEWGVDDEDLFAFALQHIDDDRPSFDFILTTTNHPPYRLDVAAKGFPLKTVPPDVALLAPTAGSAENMRVLGHLWYADRSIGDFVRSAEKKLSMPLFAFTGDHYGRRCISAKPDFFERSAVPFILYGKEVLNGVSLPAGAAGGHIDVGPTLIELAAPKGFSYHAMGRNLLAPQQDPLGMGYWRIIGRDYIADLSETVALYPLPGKKLPAAHPDLGMLKTAEQNYYGIGWWRVKRGPQL